MIAFSSTAITRKVAAATEWTACRLALQPQLGPPRFELLGWRIYHPSAFFWWWFAYDAYTREVFVDALASKMIGSDCGERIRYGVPGGLARREACPEITNQVDQVALVESSAEGGHCHHAEIIDFAAHR